MHLADESAEDVSADEVAIILSFLHPMDIMHARVCRTWRDAAKKTIIPLTKYHVDSVRKVNAMRVMSTALPNLEVGTDDLTLVLDVYYAIRQGL